MTGDLNVVELSAHRSPAAVLPLAFTELYLSDDGRGLQMVLYDQDRSLVVKLTWELASMSQPFDLNVLLTNWKQWRGCSTGPAA